MLVMLCAILVLRTAALAQERDVPGKPIGKVSVTENLILMELDQSALGQQNLFDLGQRTLRFTLGSGGYRVENFPLRWDADFGQALSRHQVALHNFSFPFSGKTWNSFSVGVTGSIRFTPESNAPADDAGPGFGPRGDEGGVSIGRFDPLTEGAASMVNTLPAICVFLKPRLYGTRYAKELDDRVVVTWDVTEPWGNIQDFTWTKTINRFQAVLHKDGTIEMSYDQLAAQDAIVGLYPIVSPGAEKTLATIRGSHNSTLPAHLNLLDVKLATMDGLFLYVTFETSGPVLPGGDAGLSGIAYRVLFDTKQPPPESSGGHDSAIVWTIRGLVPRNRAGGASSRYVAFGRGASPEVKVSGNTISMHGIVPAELARAGKLFASAEVIGPGSTEPADRVPARAFALAGVRNPEVDLSAAKPQDGALPVVYESFHYYPLP